MNRSDKGNWTWKPKAHYSPMMRACPFCGNKRVYHQAYYYGIGVVGKCPNCFAITKVKFTWLAAVDAWNEGEWSEETIHFAEDPLTKDNMNIDGALKLAEAVLSDAAETYKFWLRQEKNPRHPGDLPRIRHEIKMIEEDFFKGEGLIKALPVDGNDVISTLRKQAERKRTNHKVVDGYRKVEGE